MPRLPAGGIDRRHKAGIGTELPCIREPGDVPDLAHDQERRIIADAVDRREQLGLGAVLDEPLDGHGHLVDELLQHLGQFDVSVDPQLRPCWLRQRNACDNLYLRTRLYLRLGLCHLARLGTEYPAYTGFVLQDRL